jgi:AGCS family alanine or glycine:cation symporter
VVTVPVVWSFADIANALMALPNLVAVFLLAGVAAAETRRHLGGQKNLQPRPSDTQGTNT